MKIASAIVTNRGARGACRGRARSFVIAGMVPYGGARLPFAPRLMEEADSSPKRNTGRKGEETLRVCSVE